MFLKYNRLTILHAIALGLPLAFASGVQAQTAVVVDSAPESRAVVAAIAQPGTLAAAFEAYLQEHKAVAKDIKAIYVERGYEPVFAGPDSTALLNLIVQLGNADDHGLPASRYFPDILTALWKSAVTFDEKIELELLALEAYLGFARDLTSGIVNPRALSEDMWTKPNVRSDETLLRAMLEAGDLRQYFRTLGPSDPAYARLKAEKARLENLAVTGGWGPLVSAGSSLREGDAGGRVLALRQRLERFGYTTVTPHSDVFDDTLLEQVRRFQADNGLNDDGVAGPKTLAALNGTAEHRLEQVIVNLERLRWTNFEFGDRHIEVNIPSFTANVFIDGDVVLNTRVITGTDEHQTAEFSDEMTHLIINPTWHVPESIASEEYLPQLWEDPTLLRRENIAMLVKGSGQMVDPERIDLTQFTPDFFPFDLKQRPGEYNALGRVKFMFPNKFNIYLHDTPARSLFSRDARAFSHGCVRVQKPLELAYTLLQYQFDDPETAFQQVFNTGEETQINLVKPFQVHILYRTAFIDTDGSLQFREDIYGRDALVLGALVAEGLTLPAFSG